MVGYIYKYQNTLNSKVYIGQTTNLVNRKSKHKGCAKTVKNKFYNAVRKYGWNSFNFSIIARIESSTVEDCSRQLDFLESFYIILYDSFNNGYNSTPGGHAPRGIKRSDKYREYCKHRVYSEETRAKMSHSAKVKVVSEETRAKHRQNALLRNFSSYREKYKDKLIASIKKAKSKVVLQLDINGSLIREHPSVKETAKYIVSELCPTLSLAGAENAILRHCKGKIKKKDYCGFIWKYKTNV